MADFNRKHDSATYTNKNFDEDQSDGQNGRQWSTDFRNNNRNVETYKLDTVGKKDMEKEQEQEEEEEEREHWGSKWEFIFSCVGLSVGIGNVWRFPSLAYENGGGSFLIPYFILLIVIGKPMYYMELALGQFAQSGPVNIWRLCPLGVGVGMAQCTVSLLVAIYYNVIMCYCLYYIFASFQAEVPWAKCSKDWYQGIGSDDHCYERSNTTSNVTNPCPAGFACETSTEQFYKRAMLGYHRAELTAVNETVNGTVTSVLYSLYEVGNIGTIKWDITLCLLLSWLIVCACLIKGVKSSGKVVYFTATFPYLLLIILMIFGLTLPGAREGVKEFFVPKAWTGKNSIADPTVWRKAAEQMFYSLSISWGGLIMFGSYNKFNHKVHITATAISSLDFFTSIIAGVVIFSILGQLKLEAGVEDMKDVVKSGQGLAFIVFSDALSRLPVPQLWAVMFFFMLFLLGLDSEFAMLETTLTAFYDRIPWCRNNKPIMVTSICLFCFLISLPTVSYSGVFVFKIMDDYGGTMAVLWVAIIEMAMIMWVYGARRLANDFDFMLDIRRNTQFSKISGMILPFFWVIIPILLSVILILSLIGFEQPTYADTQFGQIELPAYAHGIGIFLVLLIVLQIPLWGIGMAVYYILSPNKSWLAVFSPTDKWGPGEKQAMIEYKRMKGDKSGNTTSAAYLNNAHLGSQTTFDYKM